MITPTFTFSIDRGLSLSPLVLSAATNVSALGVSSYREPSRDRDNTYASGSTYAPRALLASQPSPTFHALLLVPQVATQAAEDAALDELAAAIGQFAYQVVDTRNGVPRTWDCDPGSMSPINDRTRIDLAYLKPLWAVTIPCDPNPV